jgi:hypothetical protein
MVCIEIIIPFVKEGKFDIPRHTSLCEPFYTSCLIVWLMRIFVEPTV